MSKAFHGILTESLLRKKFYKEKLVYCVNANLVRSKVFASNFIF